jgi:hypothetical protein
MAIRKKEEKGTNYQVPEMAGVELVGDWASILALVFSIFVSVSVLLFLFAGNPWLAPLTTFFSALKAYVFPWIIVLALLSIGREFWAIRVYLQHIHLGNIIEKQMKTTTEARR